MNPTTPKTYTAWLVDPGDGQVVAFAETSVYRFETATSAIEVPLSHPACHQVACNTVDGVEQLVPLFDLRPRLLARNKPAGTLFLQYVQDGKKQLIGLHLAHPPCKITVEEDEFEQFKANECGAWRLALLTGFFHRGAHLPLIDPSCMKEPLFLRELEATV